jgi:hypothetical protein
MTQERLDKMAQLRRQGLTFREIGVRLGCSERTARRYAGKVQPQLHLPDANPEPESDPRALREALVSKWVHALYHDRGLRSVSLEWRNVSEDSAEAVYGGPPSVLFLSEAERRLRERLDNLGLLSLRLLAGDLTSHRRFLRETIGFLYSDYASRHQLAQNVGCGTGEDWRPPRERGDREVTNEDDLDQYDAEPGE